jgi:hypothetical protein
MRLEQEKKSWSRGKELEQGERKNRRCRRK